jgi:hypothetical protein
MAGKLDFRKEFPDYDRAAAEPRLGRFGVIPYLAIAILRWPVAAG